MFGALFEAVGDAAVGDDTRLLLSNPYVGFSGEYGFESKSLVASRIWFNVQSENWEAEMFWLRSTVGVSLGLPPFRIHVSHKLARCGSLTAESISIIVLDFWHASKNAGVNQQSKMLIA